ncbi:unannotated protein [freshwater metagenome]|uniref:Unannotated protein n=1 Tax=freshwater metagenome TaxID=449393 RepID=A0A6J6WKZ5_9ZZZZ
MTRDCMPCFAYHLSLNGRTKNVEATPHSSAMIIRGAVLRPPRPSVATPSRHRRGTNVAIIFAVSIVSPPARATQRFRYIKRWRRNLSNSTHLAAMLGQTRRCSIRDAGLMERNSDSTFLVKPREPARERTRNPWNEAMSNSPTASASRSGLISPSNWALAP